MSFYYIKIPVRPCFFSLHFTSQVLLPEKCLSHFILPLLTFQRLSLATPHVQQESTAVLLNTSICLMNLWFTIKQLQLCKNSI